VLVFENNVQIVKCKFTTFLHWWDEHVKSIVRACQHYCLKWAYQQHHQEWKSLIAIHVVSQSFSLNFNHIVETIQNELRYSSRSSMLRLVDVPYKTCSFWLYLFSIVTSIMLNRQFRCIILKSQGLEAFKFSTCFYKFQNFFLQFLHK